MAKKQKNEERSEEEKSKKEEQVHCRRIFPGEVAATTPRMVMKFVPTSAAPYKRAQASIPPVFPKACLTL